MMRFRHLIAAVILGMLALPDSSEAGRKRKAVDEAAAAEPLEPPCRAFQQGVFGGSAPGVEAGKWPAVFAGRKARSDEPGPGSLQDVSPVSRLIQEAQVRILLRAGYTPGPAAFSVVVFAVRQFLVSWNTRGHLFWTGNGLNFRVPGTVHPAA